jgi:predicted dienelactone hydrolase
MSRRWATWERVQRLAAPRSARVILFSLSELSDPAGTCQPTMRVLQDWTGLHERTIQRHLKTLKSLGLITYSAGNGARKSSFTLIDPDRPAQAEDRKAMCHA